jgi:glycosyltransferase involved in cell wall biosynthesis
MLGQHPGWVPNPAEHLAPRLQGMGFECTLTSRRINRYLRMADILWTIFHRRDQVDWVCLQVYSGLGFMVSDAASQLSRLLGKPVVMVLHGGDLPEFLFRNPGWGRRVLRRAQSIVVPSQYLSRLAADLGFRSTIVPNAIELAGYPFRLRSTVSPNLLWMRTFHEIYNPMLAVDVIKALLPSYPHASLTMAGQEKGMLEQVKQRVVDLGVQNAVRFVGYLDDAGKRREFDTHDIFLNTNHVDNMPISVIEAAVCGLPIVATRVGGIPYLLTDEVDGLLTADDDVQRMTTAIRRILEEPGLAAKLSSNARKLGEQHDWGVTLLKWAALFQELSPA